VEKVRGTQACLQHQDQWKKYVQQHKRQALSGYRRIFQPAMETPIWNRTPDDGSIEPHDAPEEEEEKVKENYFSPSRFYCVETICAPCGVVIAWAKFAKSESPTNILAFLESVFPMKESRPSYVCIDKACAVLRTSVRNKSWERVWMDTTRFIVDSYHYINHRSTDGLCRRWCNPAPLDGSAPNLVVVEKDKKGEEYYKRAFNTQVCHEYWHYRHIFIFLI